MVNHIYIYVKADLVLDMLLYLRWILKSFGADNRSWRFVSHSEYEVATAFVGNRNAVLVQLIETELLFGFLEFKLCMLGRN